MIGQNIFQATKICMYLSLMKWVSSLVKIHKGNQINGLFYIFFMLLLSQNFSPIPGQPPFLLFHGFNAHLIELICATNRKERTSVTKHKQCLFTHVFRVTLSLCHFVHLTHYFVNFSSIWFLSLFMHKFFLFSNSSSLGLELRFFFYKWNYGCKKMQLGKEA